MRILVVDDEPVVVQTLCSLIEDVGHDALGVTDGPTALDHFRRARYNVVVVDLVMPQMNGLEVLRRLHATNREARLVAMTGGLSDVDDVLHKAGIPLVRKPIITAADVRALIEAR